MKRAGIFVLILSCVAVIALASWRAGARPDPARAPKLPPVDWIHGVGYIEPATEVRRLAFKSAGVIGECAVDIGDAAKKGDILITLQNDAEAAAARLAEARLATAIAERAKVLSGVNPAELEAARNKELEARAEVDFARSEAARLKHLFNRDLASAAENENAETLVRRKEAAHARAIAEAAHLQQFVRQEDVDLANAKVRTEEAHVAVARALLEDTRIRAPFDGRVLEVLRREGEGVAAFSADPVLLFAGGPLRVRAEINEGFVSGLRANQKAEVTAPALGGVWRTATVQRVKEIMGKKTVFSRAADERKDLDVLQVVLDLPVDFHAPIGLEVDVRIKNDGASQ